MANERTLLAYMRTALSLLVAGLAVAASEIVTDAPVWLAALGLPLITMAAVVSLSAKRRFIAVQQAIRLGRPVPMPALALILPWGIASVAALGLVFMGVALASA